MLALDINDIITAAFIALVAVLLIRGMAFLFRTLLSRANLFEFDPTRLDDVLTRCYRLFPIENLLFDGTTFRRGTLVRVTTHQQTTTEGEFVGTNRSNMLCLVTHTTVVAQDLNTVESIQVIGHTDRLTS